MKTKENDVLVICNENPSEYEELKDYVSQEFQNKETKFPYLLDKYNRRSIRTY